MEEKEYSEAVAEENTQKAEGKKSLTNDSKVSVFLLAVAAALWIFAPFFKGDFFRVTALEMLAGPIFQSWDTFTEAFFGKLSYTEYVQLMSQSREFWVAIAVVVCILLNVLAVTRNNRRNAVVFSALGIVAALAPMLELVFYMITAGVKIPAQLWYELLSGFAWGYWAIAVVMIAVGFVNRKKEEK